MKHTRSAITLDDVARHAGVSASTVSRVLAGKNVVRSSTVLRVQETARRLGYVVNPHARVLAGGTSTTIGFLVRAMFGPAFSALASGVEAEAAERGSLIMISTTRGDPDREAELVKMMRDQRAAAVILVGEAHIDDAYELRMATYADALTAVGSRLVLAGRPPLTSRPNVASVQYDNVAAGHVATQHLLELGHRRILCATVTGMSTSSERLAGYRAAHAEAGLPVDDDLILEGSSTAEGTEDLVSRALSAGLNFTAVLAITDVLATGALRALRRAGVEIPDAVSVTGIDDDPTAADLDPALTTVRIPFEEVGRVAAKLCLGHRQSTDLHRVLPIELVVRHSTASPPTT
ncbi:LacI family transcriptional regulator [Brachybacterium vulturis]|uniref:LacI family transcriptional regulator n=1 Tax=Brachybacterium vulturis TaxID=2017484 RepID=A0A291GRB6_9MICO|nr:LacI family DNA-binding transcriptional regulator [Brachybacterium vulturis]ATG53023.1 LacI family transcriptional regulator [Brachybacterium vulturis]